MNQPNATQSFHPRRRRVHWAIMALMALLLAWLALLPSPAPVDAMGKKKTPTPTPTPTATPTPPGAGSWAFTGSTAHTGGPRRVVKLTDGRVLAFYNPNELEIYDPSTGAWSSGGNLTATYNGPGVALLTDGRVLFAGGSLNDGPANLVEIYDPATGATTMASTMAGPFVWGFYAAVTLNDGRVFVVEAGDSTNGIEATAQIYDPATDTWTVLEHPGYFSGGSLIPLADGRVLIFSGSENTFDCCRGEVYDPATNSWTDTGQMTSNTRFGPHMVRLLDGRVLLAGNSYDNTSAELYDPATNAFTATGSMAYPRSAGSATLLANGKVLVAGGDGGFYSSLPTTASAELYNPATGQWEPAASMNQARKGHGAVLLNDGRVLVFGGYADKYSTISLNSAELYTP